METVSALVKLGRARNNLDKNCSVQNLVKFEVENVVQECLFAFPYIWASALVSIEGSMFKTDYAYSLQPLACESQFSLMHFHA